MPAYFENSRNNKTLGFRRGLDSGVFYFWYTFLSFAIA